MIISIYQNHDLEKTNQIISGRRNLRKYLRIEDNRERNCRLSHRTTREKRRDRALRETISQASNVTSDDIELASRQGFNQHLEDLQDIRVRSSNRLSASNQPQVSIIPNFFWNYICKTS